ncbi:MAG: hypothetical protein U9M92_02485 [Patescibacteria group bacterium]|nr:hypothetical protein [Patescibacteria group bacterium]
MENFPSQEHFRENVGRADKERVAAELVANRFEAVLARVPKQLREDPTFESSAERF